MVGIHAAAAYVPRYRLPMRLVAEAWRKPPRGGACAIANHDEDSLTMAATAADWCLRGRAEPVDGVYFASTTSPYREKLAAPTIAAVADQPDGIAATDFASSLRAATTALAAAADAVAAGRLSSVLVAAADERLARPGTELEHGLGAAAAAVVVGPAEGALATLDAYFTRSDDFLHTWRRGEDRFVSSADPRFARQEGYLKNVPPAVQTALEEAGLRIGDVAHVVLGVPDVATFKAAAKALSLEPAQVVDPLFASVGHTGAAHPLLLAVAALERAEPGDRILVAAYGDGVDVALLTATDSLAGWSPYRRLADLVADGWELDTYQRYLSFRRLLEGDVASERPFSSISLLRRSARQDTRLYGGRCAACGRIQYPIPRICQGCRTEGQIAEVKLQRSGSIYTLSKEHYFPSPDPPLAVAVVDLDEGGRLVLQGTDAGDRAVGIGTRVELVFRRYHEGQGFPNYYWKCRPEQEVSA